MTTFERLLQNDDGQGLLEYALIIALVSIAALAGISLLGGKANNSVTNTANAMP